MKKVVIFARVSSTNGTQDYERQINDLQTLASANNWTVEAVFAEKVSGAKKNTERIELMNMINYINSHNIHKVLVTELSRLGRDTLQVFASYRDTQYKTKYQYSFKIIILKRLLQREKSIL